MLYYYFTSTGKCWKKSFPPVSAQRKRVTQEMGNVKDGRLKVQGRAAFVCSRETIKADNDHSGDRWWLMTKFNCLDLFPSSFLFFFVRVYKESYLLNDKDGDRWRILLLLPQPPHESSSTLSKRTQNRRTENITRKKKRRVENVCIWNEKRQDTLQDQLSQLSWDL